MNFMKKLVTIFIVLFFNISSAHSEENVVYIDLDKIVSGTKSGKLIIKNLEKSKKSTFSFFIPRVFIRCQYGSI